MNKMNGGTKRYWKEAGKEGRNYKTAPAYWCPFFFKSLECLLEQSSKFLFSCKDSCLIFLSYCHGQAVLGFVWPLQSCPSHSCLAQGRDSGHAHTYLDSKNFYWDQLWSDSQVYLLSTEKLEMSSRTLVSGYEDFFQVSNREWSGFDVCTRARY